MSCDLVEIKLTGRLGRRFGRVHRLAVDTPAEAIRALSVLFKGFRAELEGEGNEYRVAINDCPITNYEKEMHLQGGKRYTIAPVTRGSKRGLFQTILGVVLVALSFVPFLAPIAPFLQKVGVSLILGGVAQMLSPMPKTNDPNEKPENKPNTQFSGAVNTMAQGHPVPLGYGELVVGSAVISAGIDVGYEA